eukprot:scaffold3263_cov23-Tisochrysis_lutea.AAC.1
MPIGRWTRPGRLSSPATRPNCRAPSCAWARTDAHGECWCASSTQPACTHSSLLSRMDAPPSSPPSVLS